MGERCLDRALAGVFHQGIVADLVRGVQPAFHVTGLQPVAVLRGPHPGIAIGLKLQPAR